jgi:hypothetical protein
MNYGVLAVVLSLVLVIALVSFLRGRGGAMQRPEVAQFVLYDVKMNQSLVEAFYIQEKPRRFEKSNWEINKDRIGFLDESLKETLKMTFDMVEDLNQDIKLVKKNKTSHQSINVAKLVEPLATCRQGLEDWMMENVGTTELPPKYPSIWGTFFGGQ